MSLSESARVAERSCDDLRKGRRASMPRAKGGSTQVIGAEPAPTDPALSVRRPVDRRAVLVVVAIVAAVILVGLSLVLPWYTTSGSVTSGGVPGSIEAQFLPGLNVDLVVCASGFPCVTMIEPYYNASNSSATAPAAYEYSAIFWIALAATVVGAITAALVAEGVTGRT